MKDIPSSQTNTSSTQDEFEQALQNRASQQVEQGYEEISFNQTQISRGFQQCSALLLINPYDGTTFFKHAGPRSHEVVFGGGLGESLQDNYTVFMTHAETHGKKIVAASVSGTISYDREHLITHVKTTGNEAGITVDVMEPIQVPSIDWVWHLMYNPEKAYAITKHYQGNNLPVYSRHVIPGVKPETFAPTTDIAKTIKTLEHKQGLKQQIAKMVSFTQPKELEAALLQAQQELGQEALHVILTNRMNDYEGKPTEVCVSEFKRQVKGQSRLSPKDTLDCIQVLSRYDNQDERCLIGYISAVYECMEEAPRDLHDFAASKVDMMKTEITDPRFITYIEQREKIAQMLAGNNNSRRNHRYDGWE